MTNKAIMNIRKIANTSVQYQSAAVTIGNFDGVHVGHTAVLQHLVALAKERGLVPTVVTFVPSPKSYFANLRGLEPSTQIMPLRDKVTALKAAGIEQVVILPFDEALANMSAEDFVQHILHNALNTKLLMIGDDFRFGAQRKGDFALLQHLQIQYGYELQNLHTVLHDGQRISSSSIRSVLEQGKIAQATELLGHPLTLSGHIIYGQQLGRTIGFPTINLKMPQHLATQGIYAVTVRLSDNPDRMVQGAASIGIRPSVHSNGQCWCEVHLLDFNESVYGQIACVTLHHKIRDEAKFNSFDELIAAIQADVQDCRNFFAQQF